MDMEQALRVCGALSQGTRLAVFRLLVRAGPEGRAAGEIAEALGTRQNTLSSHLKQLAGAGLVRSRRDGRRILYQADFDTARGLVLYLLEDCCDGNASVCQPVAESIAVHCRG